jgi:hypothetical protein
MAGPAPVVGKSSAISTDGGTAWTCTRDFRVIMHGGDTAAVCSSTGGAVYRGSGRCDFDGILIGYKHTPLLMPGAKFKFAGTDGNGQGWITNDANNQGAIVDKVKVVCPTSQVEFIYYEMYFKAIGSMLPSSALVSDAGPPEPITSKSLGVTLDSTTLDSTAQNGILGWELTIDGNLTDPSYQSDSYVDANGNVWPIRDVGNIDAMVRYFQNIENTSSLPVLHAIKQLKLYVTSTTYWDVKWGRLLGLPVDYNIEGEKGKGEFIKAKGVTFGFTGYNGSTKGYIKDPAGTSVWPLP